MERKKDLTSSSYGSVFGKKSGRLIRVPDVGLSFELDWANNEISYDEFKASEEIEVVLTQTQMVVLKYLKYKTNYIWRKISKWLC